MSSRHEIKITANLNLSATARSLAEQNENECAKELGDWDNLSDAEKASALRSALAKSFGKSENDIHLTGTQGEVPSPLRESSPSEHGFFGGCQTRTPGIKSKR